MNSLTPCETKAAAEIADWLSSRASFPGTAIKFVTSPFARLTRRAIPREKLLNALHKTENFAFHHAEMSRVLADAGVQTAEELKQKPLEFCDELADRYSIRAERAAMIDGVVAGLGGTVTEIMNLPILLGAALRTITMIGHAYGYVLNGEYAQNYILLILDLSTVDDPIRRQKIFHMIRLMEHRHAAAKHDKSIPVEEIAESVTEDVELSMIEQITLESIPVAGDLISMILDYDFMHHVDMTARYVFRERRLRESGKIKRINPSPVSKRRKAYVEAIEATSQIGYMFGYGLSFVGSYPYYLVRAKLKPIFD